jgi:hypothetical protein
MPRSRIPDIRAAMESRAFPTVTIWNRLEGRPRTTEFGRALKAEVRDALWMLTRQWQMGEFLGEDAGSPVTATYHLQATRATRYRAQEGAVTDLPAALPMETVVEARTLPFVIGADLVSLDLRLALGRRWLKLAPAELRGVLLSRWPFRLPDPAAEADTTLVSNAGVWATCQALAGRAMDGYELYRHLKAGGHPYDGISGLTPAQRGALDALVPRFVPWFEDLIAQPSGPGAFDPQRLEHRFSIAAPAASGETVLTAAEYPGGQLDWYAFSHDASGTALGGTDPAARSTVTRTVLPGTVRFAGMPHPRWWAFEDGRTDFGAITPDTTDVLKLLFVEFALIFSNDWFLLPCDLDAGTLATIDGLAVTDVFGQPYWIEPAGSGADDDWQRWSMFNLDIAGAGPATADTSIYLPPSTPHTAEGPPVEGVVLIRDENANMVWGVERTVWPASGEGMPGAEAARETLANRQRLQPPAPPVVAAAPISYEAMTTVPENWIPFIPVHVPGDNREIQLQRGAMPRVLGAGPVPPAKVRPRTTLLREGLDAAVPQPYFVHEEEVQRAGTRLTLAFNRSRRADGHVLVWLSVRRSTGRGEGSSGLEFDRIADTP